MPPLTAYQAAATMRGPSRALCSATRMPRQPGRHLRTRLRQVSSIDSAAPLHSLFRCL